MLASNAQQSDGSGTFLETVLELDRQSLHNGKLFHSRNRLYIHGKNFQMSTRTTYFRRSGQKTCLFRYSDAYFCGIAFKETE